MQRLSRASTIVGLALLALAGGADNAHAIECRASKGTGHPWAWRQIDGKRCWYKGRAGKNKKLLRWAKAAEPKVAKRGPSRLHERHEQHEPPAHEPHELTEGRGLPLEPPRELTFEERWCTACLRGQQ